MAEAVAAGCLSAAADRFGVVSGPSGSYLGERGRRRDHRGTPLSVGTRQCAVRERGSSDLIGGTHHGGSRSRRFRPREIMQ